MGKRTYVLDDEPATGGAAQRFIVDPQWPLLAVMLAGVWIGWPWLLFNGWALGSPSWRRQARLLALGLAVTVALALAIVWALRAGWVTELWQLRAMLLVVTVWKLGVSYKVRALQIETFELYRYYGGVVVPGSRLVVLAMSLSRVLFAAIDSAVWLIIITGGLVFLDVPGVEALLAGGK